MLPLLHYWGTFLIPLSTWQNHPKSIIHLLSSQLSKDLLLATISNQYCAWHWSPLLFLFFLSFIFSLVLVLFPMCLTSPEKRLKCHCHFQPKLSCAAGPSTRHTWWSLAALGCAPAALTLEWPDIAVSSVPRFKRWTARKQRFHSPSWIEYMN